MINKIILLDDTPQILAIKARALEQAGFMVDAYCHPHEGLVKLADSILFEHDKPYALVTDNELGSISGPAIITYLSPLTDTGNPLVLDGMRAVLDMSIVPYRSLQDLRKIYEINNMFKGKLILTSRQDLKPQAIGETLTKHAKSQLAVLNEALRIGDRTFKIGSDGSGMERIIDYLRQTQ